MRVGSILLLVIGAHACGPADDAGLKLPGTENGFPLTTDAEEYILSETEAGMSVRIPFAYENRGDHATWIQLGCHGDMHTALERLGDEGWTQVWYRYDHGCPHRVVLLPGESHESATELLISPARGALPRFEADTIPGVYRVVLSAWAVRPYDVFESQPLGDSVPKSQRISNPFRLWEPKEAVWHRRLLRFLRPG